MANQLLSERSRILCGASAEPILDRPKVPVRELELTVVVPTFNERENIEPLLARMEIALSGVEWEVIFVDDDSPDNTAEKVRNLARINPRIRCLQRIARRGLSTAVI